MKSVICMVLSLVLVDAAMAATPAAGRGRATMAGQMAKTSRAVASKNQISAMATMAPDSAVSKSSIKAGDPNANLAINPDEMISATKNMREEERAACLGNNIGIGNTFVWASRYSNTGNYATMLEDTVNPENNTCFVRVELKSQDERVDLSDIPAVYQEVGQMITCGSWANEDDLRQRILDAKKNVRAWATVGGVVGGAGIGVGAMELFGNAAIGGAVQGQKALEGQELLKSQLAVLQKENKSAYDGFMADLRELKALCEGNPGVVLENTDVKAKCDSYAEFWTLVK